MLFQITVYKAHASTTRRENVIVSLTHGAVAPGSSSYWRGELLHVPPTPPSGLQGCSIIDLSYVCRVGGYQCEAAIISSAMIAYALWEYLFSIPVFKQMFLVHCVCTVILL